MAYPLLHQTGRSKLRLGNMLLASAAFVAFSAGILLFVANRVKLTGEETRPSGLWRNYSLYVKIRDSTRLAVDVWLPADYHADEQLPVLMRSTRYWGSSAAAWIAVERVAAPRATGCAIYATGQIFQLR
jgi:predicted acyl esterase